MTKIAIISQPEQGVLIDVGGCTSVQEATQHLTSTFQVSSQFWQDQPVDLNFGSLVLNREQLGQVLSTLSEVGVRPRLVFASTASTKAALRAHNIAPADGLPASLPDSAGRAQPIASQESQVAADLAPERQQPSEALGTACGATTAALSANALQEGASPICNTQSTAPLSAAVADGAGSTPLEAPAAAAANASQGNDQALAKAAAPHVLYLRQTLRSGQSLSHKGHLVIIGDVNPGAEVIAEGDITIWGVLRGIAHAGVAGNTSAEIRALRFDPLQLRIAHAIARAPDRPRPDKRSAGPEIARIVEGTIRIASSTPD